MECPSYETLLSKEKLIKVVQTLCYKIGNGGGGTSFSDLGYSSFDSTATYSKGDVVEKDGTLYEFTTSHTGDWDASDVQETSVEALIEENYKKPSSGIPSTDLDSAIQTSLGKADTAEQSMAIVAGSGTSLSAALNTYYLFGSAVGTLAITLPAVTDTTHVQNIVFMLTTDSSPAVTFAASGTGINVIAQDGFSIEASTTYEINAIFNGVAWVVASMKLSSTPINS